MKSRLLLGISLGALLIFGATAGSQPAEANSCIVPSGTFPTITSAVKSGNCSLITVAAGTFPEHHIQINSSLTLRGAGANSTVVDGGGADSVFLITPGNTVTISSLRIQNGSATNGGGINNQGTLSLVNSRLTYNKASNFGGGIYDAGSGLTVTNTSFYSNSSTGGGGAIDHESGSLGLYGATLTSNRGNDNGGAIRSVGGTLNMNRSNFQKNWTAGEGGAIYTSVPTNVVSSQFISNVSVGNGGAIEEDGAPAPVTINQSTFRGNRSRSWGGALDNQMGNYTITGSYFFGNASIGGGAMNNDGGTLNINTSAFAYNTATTDVDGGGAIWTSIPTRIVNTTFYQNTAHNGQGGGINADGSTVTLLNDTFVGNIAPTGGNISATTGTLKVQNTIMAGGQPNNCAVIEGALFSLGSNLSSDNSCASYFTVAGDHTHTSPLLGGFQNNGGSTPSMVPQPNSPAINGVLSGCPPPAVDQRGFPRPHGPRCDIGSIEVQ